MMWIGVRLMILMQAVETMYRMAKARRIVSPIKNGEVSCIF
jgi:hypothetical protein